MGAGILALTLAGIGVVAFVAAAVNMLYAFKTGARDVRGTMVRHFVFGISMVVCEIGAIIAGIIWIVQMFA